MTEIHGVVVHPKTDVPAAGVALFRVPERRHDDTGKIIPAGIESPATLDETGHFSIELPPGPMQVHLNIEGAGVDIDWVTFEVPASGSHELQAQILAHEGAPTNQAAIAALLVLLDGRYAGIGGAALPAGGTAGQVLTKGSGTDAGWADPTGGGGGSTAWGSITDKPAVIAAGTTQAAARTAIGAGTSNLAIGTSGTTAAAGNDARLSDQRVPTNGSVTPAKIAATGTASSGTFLRGDGAWATPAGGGSGGNYARVLVVTGAEERPDVDYVDWIGGTERPDNMSESGLDLWFEFAPTPDVTAPSVPSGLASSSITASGFTLSWSAATDAVGVTGYEARVNSGTAVAVSGLSHAFTGLSASTVHAAQVRARDAAGNWSAWSTALNVTTSASSDVTAPTVPTGLASSAITSTGFTVSWTASTDAVGVTGYEVFIGGVSYATPSGTSQAVTGRTAATAHSVTVRARDAAGNWSAQSSALSVTTSAASSDPWVNRSTASVARNGTTSHTYSFTPATSGALLVMVIAAAATITTPSGWTRRTQALNNTELSVYTKTATAAEASVGITLSATNYPAGVVVYQFTSAATWVNGTSSTTTLSNGVNPSLSGLTGTNLVFSASCGATTGSTTASATTWSGATGITEDIDAYIPFDTTDGLAWSLAYVKDFAGATFSPSKDMVLAGGGPAGTKESITFAVKLS